MRGRLIVIEGTDCSGKETQSKKLIEHLNSKGRIAKYYSFPMYDTPTGKIIGGPYLGKSYICEGWFPETAPNVDPKVSSLYYAADRLYNIPKIIEELDNGVDVVLDRYFYSNMAHQGGKLKTKRERNSMYNWLYKLEVGFLKLPIPDVRIFIHMPYQASNILKKDRVEAADQLEANIEHLKKAERDYIEIANKFDFKIIECVTNNKNITKESIKSIESINEEINKYIDAL